MTSGPRSDASRRVAVAGAAGGPAKRLRSDGPALGRRLVVSMALSLLAFGAPVHAFELPELMKLLSLQRGGEASFTEQRFVRGLDAPLEASGTLSFAAPDRFVRRTAKPREESMAVEGNQLTLTRGGRTRSMQLDAVPELLGLVEAVRGTLTGNAPLLARHFRSALAGSERAWTLELVPLERGILSAVAKLRIAGERGELRRIEIDLADGDSSVMTIGPLRPQATVNRPGPTASAATPAS